ncbi:hypothetical protein ETSB_0159 [cyanobacterium endosymbiont of Epithemia turgida isolate EtSB Lake Yunoko]|nr:hypothetical protein ETSB_0159 [cyanobacterium endosymbiont of Epithemia turgida isolate EtSB Lake Yunoko]
MSLQLYFDILSIILTELNKFFGKTKQLQQEYQKKGGLVPSLFGAYCEWT